MHPACRIMFHNKVMLKRGGAFDSRGVCGVSVWSWREQNSILSVSTLGPWLA